MWTRAIVFRGPGEVEVGEVEVPEVGPGEYLVETLFTAVSPGTELRNMSGEMPGVRFPFVGGYSNVGRVVGRGPGVSGEVAEGELVFCSGTQRVEGVHRMYGGHIAHAVTNTVHPIPAGVEAMDAVMAKLAAIAYHGARVARTTPGDVVAVVGLGPIGQLAQRAHHLHGARVVGFDLSGERVAVARAAGFEAVEIRGDLAETAREVTPAGFDVVVDATGVPAVLRQAIELLRDRGWNEPVETGARLVVQGSYAGDLAVNYQEFFMKGASLVVPRDHQAVDLRLVLGLLARKRLAVRDLVSEVASPELAGDVFRRLGARAGSQMTAVFSWE